MKMETFSYLPPMTDEQVAKQVRYIVEQGLIPAIEHSPGPDPYDSYWHLWSLPMTDVTDAGQVMAELQACRAANPDDYVKVVGYDNVKQCQVAAFVAYPPR